jgi:hypothetical protein
MIKIEFARTAPLRPTRIRIVRVPASGIAPEEVRRAWVGVELPLHAPGMQRTTGYGILSAPNSRVLRWLRARLGIPHPDAGYVVKAGVAVAELAREAPEAALWFRENVPQLLEPGQLFLFAADECRIIATE